MNRSTPGLPVHHQLPEFTQTHVHQVGDAIQPSRVTKSQTQVNDWTIIIIHINHQKRSSGPKYSLVPLKKNPKDSQALPSFGVTTKRRHMISTLSDWFWPRPIHRSSCWIPSPCIWTTALVRGFPGSAVVRNPPANAGAPVLIPGSGKSLG